MADETALAPCTPNSLYCSYASFGVVVVVVGRIIKGSGFRCLISCLGCSYGKGRVFVV